MKKILDVCVRFFRYFFFLAILTSPSTFADQIVNETLLITPEKTNYQNTSTHADVISVLDALEKSSDLVYRETLLTTQDGKDVPLLVLSDPLIKTPEQAKESGKVVIYIQGNIHGGEVEGKEASLLLMRDILLGDKKYLLDNQILVFVPIYNADGNDRMAEDNRPSQEGSPLLAGERFSHGFDLNRDGVVLETPENKALMAGVFNRWDPDLFIDLHTTNGTWHGYNLTYAPSYQTAGEAATTEYTTDVLLPAVQKAMVEKHNLDTSWFGDFDVKNWPVSEFKTYHHAPRYLTNMMGLRNRMAILSETFAHERFYQRIRSAKAFIEEILIFTNENAKEIRKINRDAEKATLDKIKTEIGSLEKGVRYQMVPLEQPLDLKAYNHLVINNSNGEKQVIRQAEIITLKNVKNFNRFEAIQKALVPKAYAFSADFEEVANLLRNHGIKVDTLDSQQILSGHQFYIESKQTQRYKLNGHPNQLFDGQFKSVEKTFSKGDYIVSMESPLANVIFYLLEPESDDGLGFWNFFDIYLQENSTNQYPIFKVFP